MKKIILLSVLVFSVACQKEQLRLTNPNAPGPASIYSEEGAKAFALGIYEKAFGWALDGWLLIALSYHSALGDEIYIPWANFYERWAQQYSKIRLPNGQEYQHTSMPGVSQKERLQSFNTTSAGSSVFLWEWCGAYFSIGQANKLLEVLNDPTKPIEFSGNAITKINTLKAWGLWWKGYMYSRLGSMYLSGIIVSELGEINSNYVDRTLIIDEATKNFDAAIELLNNLAPDDDYNETMLAIVPNFNDNFKIVTPGAWIRMINTYKARNILVNKKRHELSGSDWNEIQTLASNGLHDNDNIFTLGMSLNRSSDLSLDFHPYVRCNDGWTYWLASERLIQEYKPGDVRLTKNFHILSEPYVNVRDRGWIFGGFYGFVNIEEGGSYATSGAKGQWPISPTYEENELILAEASIMGGDIEEGLSKIDIVRSFQNSGLSPVAGTGMNQSQALEELRRERRTALALRGLAFYDARRWMVTAPESSSGGRSDAMIVIPANVYDPENDGVPASYPCYIEYNYMDYWDVPANELDFNTPKPGSASVKN